MKTVLALSFLAVALMSCGRIKDIEKKLNELGSHSVLPKVHPTPTPTPTPTIDAGQEYFFTKVYPSIVQKCAICHGKDKQLPILVDGNTKTDYDTAKALLPDNLVRPGHYGDDLQSTIADWSRAEGL